MSGFRYATYKDSSIYEAGKAEKGVRIIDRRLESRLFFPLQLADAPQLKGVQPVELFGFTNLPDDENSENRAGN